MLKQACNSGFGVERADFPLAGNVKPSRICCQDLLRGIQRRFCAHVSHIKIIQINAQECGPNPTFPNICSFPTAKGFSQPTFPSYMYSKAVRRRSGTSNGSQQEKTDQR